MNIKESIIDKLELKSGAHASIEQGACIMELVSYVAGEPWSDHPKCACPILTEYAIRLNDRFSNEHRQRMKPFILQLVGTRIELDDVKIARKRFLMWRNVTATYPLLLELFKLQDLADTLRKFPNTVDGMNGARDFLKENKDKIYKASDVYANANANAYVNDYAYVYANANANAYVNAYAYVYANANADADAYVNANADANAYAYVYANANADAYAYAYAYADAYAYAYSDAIREKLATVYLETLKMAIEIRGIIMTNPNPLAALIAKGKDLLINSSDDFREYNKFLHETADAKDEMLEIMREAFEWIALASREDYEAFDLSERAIEAMKLIQAIAEKALKNES